MIYEYYTTEPLYLKSCSGIYNKNKLLRYANLFQDNIVFKFNFKGKIW